MFTKILKNSEKGQAMIEYAIILPIFLLVLFAVIDVGWITYQKAMFTYTCRQTGWDMRLKEDDEWVLHSGVPISRDGGYANMLLTEQFRKVNGEKDATYINLENITVTNGSVVIYPGKKDYKTKTPDYLPKTTSAGNGTLYNTTTVEVKGKIEYRVRPLTPFFKVFAKDGENKNELTFTNNLYKIKRSAMKTVYD